MARGLTEADVILWPREPTRYTPTTDVTACEEVLRFATDRADAPQAIHWSIVVVVRSLVTQVSTYLTRNPSLHLSQTAQPATNEWRRSANNPPKRFVSTINLCLLQQKHSGVELSWCRTDSLSDCVVRGFICCGSCQGCFGLCVCKWVNRRRRGRAVLGLIGKLIMFVIEAQITYCEEDEWDELEVGWIVFFLERIIATRRLQNQFLISWWNNCN